MLYGPPLSGGRGDGGRQSGDTDISGNITGSQRKRKTQNQPEKTKAKKTPSSPQGGEGGARKEKIPKGICGSSIQSIVGPRGSEDQDPPGPCGGEGGEMCCEPD